MNHDQHSGHHDGHGHQSDDQPSDEHQSHEHQSHEHESHEHHAHGGESTGGHSGGHDHDKHAGHSVAMFRDRFWLSLILAIPTLVWSPMLQEWLSFSAPSFPMSEYVPTLFGSVVFLYGGRVFLQGAWSEIRAGLPGMMTLISLAITVAFGYSLAVTLGWDGEPLWWELASLVVIMLLGHWIEMRSIHQARGALRELAKLLPDTAERLVDGEVETVPVSRLSEGDLLLVRPGASVPADGTIEDGNSGVDEAAISGESKPVDKAPGDEVIAGTVNGSGALRVRVTGTGDGTALAGIMRLVEEAQASRSRAQALADRAARALTWVALGAGAVTFVVWMAVGGDSAYAVQRLVAVLVIACPHALGLAVPLVVAISTSLGASNGLLVRDRRGLEEARSVDAVVFDKTGTLTTGDFGVVEVTVREGRSEDEVLALAAAVEGDSEHTIARGIVKSAEEKSLTVPDAEGFQAIPGHGAKATVGGVEFQIGGPALLRKLQADIPEPLREAGEASEGRGQTTVYLLEGDLVLGVIGLADRVRPESREAVQALHDLEVEVVMLTGDAEPVARAVAADLGIDSVFAEVLPDQKAEKIRELQSKGRSVAMVGDGVNDAPALVTADVGVAIGAGTDAAVEAGDVVLVRSDPRDLPRIITLSRATYRKMIQNLWWAAGYNIVAIPLAAGALAPWGIVMPPAFAAVLMSASTVIVALNAQLLRRTDMG